jgi:hypothetical protein
MLTNEKIKHLESDKRCDKRRINTNVAGRHCPLFLTIFHTFDLTPASNLFSSSLPTVLPRASLQHSFAQGSKYRYSVQPINPIHHRLIHTTTHLSSPNTHHHGRHSSAPILYPCFARNRPWLGNSHPWRGRGIATRTSYGQNRCEQVYGTSRAFAHARAAFRHKGHSRVEAVQPPQKANQATIPWTSASFLRASPGHSRRLRFCHEQFYEGSGFIETDDNPSKSSASLCPIVL